MAVVSYGFVLYLLSRRHRSRKRIAYQHSRRFRRNCFRQLPKSPLTSRLPLPFTLWRKSGV
jgi:hypothetical protein